MHADDQIPVGLDLYGICLRDMERSTAAFWYKKQFLLYLMVCSEAKSGQSPPLF